MPARSFDSEDRRVLVVRQVANFLEEALADGPIRHQSGVWNLDDDLSFELVVPGEIDGSHAPMVEGFLDLVAIVEPLTDEPVFVFRFGIISSLVQAR